MKNTKIIKDNNGNEMLCEIKKFEGMTQNQIDDMLQEMEIINEKGEKENIDLRYR